MTCFGQQNVSRNDGCHFQSKLLRGNVLFVIPFLLVTVTGDIPDGRSTVITKFLCDNHIKHNF